MQFIKNIITLPCLICLIGFSQVQPALQDIMLKPMRGANISFSAAVKKEPLILLCFWATASEESVNELNAINSHFQQWSKSAHFKILAISVDENKTRSRVRPLSAMNEWLFDVYIDVNGDLKKNLHANNLPEAMILKDGKVVYQQSGFDPGSENYLMEKIRAMQ